MSASAGDSPRGFYFWALAPFLVLFLIIMPLIVQPPTIAGVVILWVVELLVALALLGLFNPLRFWWAWRGVGAIIFVGYVAYLIAMISERKFAAARRAEPTVINALVGLFVFGFPGLWYALFGRLTPRRQSLIKNDEQANDDGA